MSHYLCVHVIATDIMYISQKWMKLDYFKVEKFNIILNIYFFQISETLFPRSENIRNNFDRELKSASLESSMYVAQKMKELTDFESAFAIFICKIRIISHIFTYCQLLMYAYCKTSFPVYQRCKNINKLKF